MAIKKPLVLNNGQLQQKQTGDTIDTVGLFDPASNLGGINGLATNGLTVHNGTAFTTVTLTAPAAGMTITNPDGTGGTPTFAFTAELADLLSIAPGIVVKDVAGNLTPRSLAGTTNQITVTNGDGVAGNPTFTIANNVILPGTQAVTVPMGDTTARGTAANGMMRYNTLTNQFEFYQNNAWVQYGTSNTAGTVTSVDVALPDSIFSASSGAITTAGTISFTLDTQLANTVFAAPDGVTGTPTFRTLVAADIPALDWTKITTGKPTTLAGYGITDAVINTTQVIAGTGLTGGGALSGNVTISMPAVGIAVTDQFRKITTDTQGRVSATSAVTAGDITTALGYTPVNKAGDTMNSGANLTFAGGGTVTGLPLTAVSATDAASKAYVDNVVASGTTWRDPVVAPNLMDVVTTVPTTPTSRQQFIAFGGVYPQTWGTLTDVAEGDILEYQVSPVAGWVHIGKLSAGDRFTIAYAPGEVVGTTLYAAGFRRMDLIQYVSGNPTLDASWTTPHQGGHGAVLYTAPIATTGATALAATTTYTASIKIGATAYPISLTTTTANPLWSAVLLEINTDIDGNTGTVAVASISNNGHLHIEATNPANRVIISDTNLFSTAAAGMDIHATVLAGTTVLVSNILSQDNGRTGLFSGGIDGSDTWVEIGGPTAINAGVGLVYDGNVLNVNLGAGIKESPTDEVGLDLRTGALWLTTDDINPSTLTNAALGLRLDGTTLVQSATGLKVASGGITGTELNASVAGAGLTGGGGSALSVVTDGSSLEITGDSLNIKAAGVTPAMLSAGVAGLGLVNTGTSLDVNVGAGALEIQTDVLNIKAAGVTNAMLANSSITFAGTSGTPAATSLGGTFTIAAGTGITTTASAGTVTVALNATLDNLSDVTITTAAAGDLIYRNAGNTAWVNGAAGAASGVQPYDTTLNALAQLSGVSGMVVETGVDAFVTRVIQGTAGQITVVNGDGIAGDPTLSLNTVGTAGTYSSVTVDSFGRVTAGSAVEASTQVAMVNANAGTLTIGTPVYVSAAGSVDKTDASTMPQAKCIGLVASASINTTATGNIAVAGILDATTGQWDAVTGQTGGLTAGGTYFLSETTGLLTTTAPTAGYIAPIGIALSTTKMKIDVGSTIQL